MTYDTSLPEDHDPWVSVNEGLPPYESNSQDEHSLSGSRIFGSHVRDGLRSLISGSSKTEDILIAVMGMTGVGKTSFISDVTGKKLEVGHDLESCTSSIEVVTTEINGRTVHLIDTPGFDDTNTKDSDILLRISEYLQHDEVRLSGLLYLHRITDPRVGHSAMKNIRMFRKLVGEDNMKNVVLVTTFWSQVTPTDGERRRQQLQQTGAFWGDLIRFGATCYDYRSRPEDALRLVRRVMDNHPRVTRLQRELRQGATLSQTAAGKEVAQEMERMKADYETRLKEMQEEMESAQQEKDEALTNGLKAYYEKLLAEEKARSEAAERFFKKELEGMQKRLTEVEGRSRCVIM